MLHSIGWLAYTEQGVARSARLGGNIGVSGANDNVKKGLVLQGYAELNLASDFAFRGTALYSAGDTKVDVLSEGDFSMLGVEGSLIYTLPSQAVAPYIGGGLGHYMPENEFSDGVVTALASIGVRGEEDLQSGIGFHAMGGIAFEIAPNVLVDLNIKYVHFKTDVVGKATDFVTFESFTTDAAEIDLTTLFITAGLKFMF